MIATGKRLDCQPANILAILTSKDETTCDMACVMERDCTNYALGKTGTAEAGKCILYSAQCAEVVDVNYDSFLTSAKTNPKANANVCTHKQELSAFYENEVKRTTCDQIATEQDCTADSNCVFTPRYGVKFFKSGCKDITPETTITTLTGKTAETCNQACTETMLGKCVEFMLGRTHGTKVGECTLFSQACLQYDVEDLDYDIYTTPTKTYEKLASECQECCTHLP